MSTPLLVAVLCCLLSGTASTQWTASTQFFPPHTFSESPDLEETVVKWYSEQLSGMQEPSLSNQKQGETYRFLWLRSFHDPYAFRLRVLPDGGGTITVKSTYPLSPERERSCLTLDKTRRLTPVQVRRVLSVLEELDFWNLPTRDRRYDEDGAQWVENDGAKWVGTDGTPRWVAKDGAKWVFEGTRSGQYHIVDRWSPDEGAFRELMLSLMQLAGVNVQPIY